MTASAAQEGVGHWGRRKVGGSGENKKRRRKCSEDAARKSYGELSRVAWVDGQGCWLAVMMEVIQSAKKRG